MVNNLDMFKMLQKTGQEMLGVICVMDSLRLSWTVYACHGQSTPVMGSVRLSWVVYACHGQSTPVMDCIRLYWRVCALNKQSMPYMNSLCVPCIVFVYNG